MATAGNSNATERMEGVEGAERSIMGGALRWETEGGTITTAAGRRGSVDGSEGLAREEGIIDRHALNTRTDGAAERQGSSNRRSGIYTKGENGGGGGIRSEF